MSREIRPHCITCDCRIGLDFCTPDIKRCKATGSIYRGDKLIELKGKTEKPCKDWKGNL